MLILPLHKLRKDPHENGSNLLVNTQLIATVVAITIIIRKCIVSFGQLRLENHRERVVSRIPQGWRKSRYWCDKRFGNVDGSTV